ncbi:DUF4169 family protein [Chthonobacter rhizosphaerae]|uniref:DUF4169 family protein n=1 Tax=Chthonobacter rhizosphaerae TaxID=2735553 RepID=UPI0015EF41CA|nr:DUF4169 family protein [Chthonobacter rhizosphaerae]
MGEVVNLRLHRKRKEREDREQAASANRAKFGRTKAEKEVERAVLDLDRRKLDAHKRETDPADPA